MTTTSDVKITAGAGTNVATWDITEDAETKKIQRVGISKSDGSEVDFTSGTAGTPAGGVSSVQGVAGMVPLSGFPLPVTPVSGAISTAMTGTTSTSLVAAPGASLRNYITCIIVSNSHATVSTDILIQDGSGGTTLMVIPAAAAYGGAVIPLPTPLKQPTLNTALYAQNVTTGSNTKVSAVGFSAA